MSTVRLPKFRRVPEAVAGKAVTERGIEIIQIIAAYRLISTSTLVSVANGNADVTNRHLQRLYHQGFISRFTLPRRGNPGEFIYFLEDAARLRMIAYRLSWDVPAWAEVRRNREKFGGIASDAGEDYGKFLFIRHELMISDFRASLELACRASEGRVELERWTQGAGLWSRVRMPSKKILPHRPDAFFTLRFPLSPEGQQRANYFYEADRDTSNVTRMREKFEAHVEYLKQGKQAALGVKRIRAVLVETISTERMIKCMEVVWTMARVEPVAQVAFWFSSARGLEAGFKRRWAPLEDQERSLLD